MNPHIGSDFDDFLEEEGILEEVEAAAIKKVIACMIAQTMAEANITKTEMAKRMDTSRIEFDKLLNPNCHSVTFITLTKATSAVGKKFQLALKTVTHSWQFK